MYSIQTFNRISPIGLNVLKEANYQIGDNIEDPDGLLLRSQSLHDFPVGPKLKAVSRAGTGVNNIPIATLSELGIPVFNTPGANANAVKELVLAGLLLAARNICQGWKFTQQITGDDTSLSSQVEANKKQFSGIELPGRTLAVIGLGAIGVKVANAALALGMNVVGFDPGITVRYAWQLSSNVTQADDFKHAVKNADFVTVHVPAIESTKHLLNKEAFAAMKKNCTVLNFSRGSIVDEAALLEAMETKKVQCYVTDFISSNLQNKNNIICLPHLGASTKEAEENCARLAAQELRDYLNDGTIMNSVNFPNVRLSRNHGFRLAITHANIPNMLGQISSTLAAANLNIVEMINKSRNDLAYTLLDVENQLSDEMIGKIKSIEGVKKLLDLGSTLN